MFEKEARGTRAYRQGEVAGLRKGREKEKLVTTVRTKGRK